MAQVKLTLNGITMSVDAKAVPELLLALSGKSAPTKSYIGAKELATIKASSAEEFVLKALDLQDGIHVKYSGLNDAIRSRYGKDPIVITSGLRDAGKLAINPTKGGVRISKPVVKK